MTTSSLELHKLWEDEHFFELSIVAHSPACRLSINIYSSNDELEDLRNGLVSVSHRKTNDFVWVSGDEKENVTHYIRFHIYPCSKRGHIAFEVSSDNKLEPPYRVKTNFFLITEVGSVDEFAVQLGNLIHGKSSTAEGLIYTQF